MENEVEELDGCMCEYIPVELRNQIEAIAEKTAAYTSQVVTYALQIGLGVLANNLQIYAFKSERGEIKQKKILRASCRARGFDGGNVDTHTWA